MIDLCPVCGSCIVDVKSKYRAIHPIFKGMNRVHCNSCTMEFASPMPDENLLSEYNSNYFESAHGGAETNTIGLAFFSAIARLRQAYVEAYLASRQLSVSSVLELGPGLGFFASAWLAKHPCTEYFAHETDVTCHFELNKIGVQLVHETTNSKLDPAVDLVVMSHVLEHVIAPKDFIKQTTRNLRTGGVIFIEVPCMDYQHKLHDEPHLLFFDKKSMNQLLEATGFENIELAYFGQEIDDLKAMSIFKTKWEVLRSRLLRLGVLWPFASKKAGMESLQDPLERAAVAPFKAHIEASKPAWWLRAVAQKV